MSAVSVVIRAKNEEEGIGRTLDLLDAQSRRPDEVIVVDSGSTDATPEIVRASGARLIEIPASSFTYGGSLNTGCEAASGDVLVALSAHAYPEDRDWIALLEETLADDQVACATGVDHDPDGAPLAGPLRQDAALVHHNPFWGYSNAAGAFRASLWRERPWRADMPWTEDKEWALYWLERGYVCVVDPRLRVAHSHTSDPAREQFRRARLEWVGLGMFIPVERQSPAELMREWWNEQETYPNAWRARLAPNRLARLAGKWAGRRQAARAVPRTAIITDIFPAVSETFIANEIRELNRLDHRVVIEANGHADPGDAGTARELPAHYLVDEALAAKPLALAMLTLRAPHAVACDLRDRRRWAREEPVRPLRALAPRAARLRAAGVSHLHVHFAANAALDGMRLSRLLGIPWSVTAHAYEIFMDPTNLREKLETADFVTSGCDYNVRVLREIAPTARIERVVMGVDPDAFARTTPYPGGREVIAIGRLVPKKGFADLVAAMVDVPDAHLTLVGDGDLRGDLAAQAHGLELGDRVSLVGRHSPSSIRDLLEQADVLAMPCIVAPDGDRDSMPVVVKEALAMELPVVATDEVGLPELVRPEFGRLVPPSDPAALAAALRALLDLPAAERAAMGRAGREYVTRHCDVRAESKRVSDLVREVGR